MFSWSGASPTPDWRYVLPTIRRSKGAWEATHRGRDGRSYTYTFGRGATPKAAYDDYMRQLPRLLW